jgi:hypothetical protein
MKDGVFGSDYLKRYKLLMYIITLRQNERKKDQIIKINENEKILQDNTLQTKETLYQKFSNKDPQKNVTQVIL